MLSGSTHQLLLRRVVRELLFELVFSGYSSRDHTADELAGDPRDQVTLCLHMSFPTVRVWEPSLSCGNASQINTFSTSSCGQFCHHSGHEHGELNLVAHHDVVISASGDGGRKMKNSRPASATKAGAGDVVHLAEHLPNMKQALGSMASVG